MDSDGTHLHRLTNLQAEDPAFSPDGRRIAFVSIEASQPLIYIVNADGSNIINTAQVGYAPAWRPDGRRIAFNCGAAPPQICAMDDDGANLRRLTGDHFPDYAPQYSPDGRTIVFFSGRVCAPSCAEIYAMSANGSNIHRIGASQPATLTRPSFTPDGRILFVRTEWHRRPNGTLQVGGSQIYIMNADGTHVRQLTRSSSQNTFAAFGYSY
jgi:TolB protein